MTERGLPIVDGAPACPFVAFDDDRDERSTSPDHRHRCYAESPPAPRALAHQEAYCLASAFPVCPTFQDWARREAARTRSDEPPRDDDGELEPVVIDRPPRKGSSTWSAPPPWSGRDDGSRERAAERAGASPYASDDPSEAADAGMAAGAAAAGMVGAAGAMGAAGAAAAGSSAGSAAGRTRRGRTRRGSTRAAAASPEAMPTVSRAEAPVEACRARSPRSSA
jgi:hypothetical protein